MYVKHAGIFLAENLIFQKKNAFLADFAAGVFRMFVPLSFHYPQTGGKIKQNLSKEWYWRGKQFPRQYVYSGFHAWNACLLMSRSAALRPEKVFSMIL